MVHNISSPAKLFYKGDDTDFVIFVESEEAVNDYLKDSSIPLSDSVAKFQIYKNSTSTGAEGELDQANSSELDNEFGTHSIDDVIETIMKKGTFKGTAPARLDSKKFSSTNDSNGVYNH
ncbi:unnamed protein product [Kuraishia capsulata CBS 1993]|uniref:Ribosome maturation protein SDO1/SBDS N-terminal domain-containing protein n=1 Tax=Kuraishia capsulata CBS 1993 TaxID=1382522 RepID=W6MK58_9ASCO|nr:uncharacterized protein KUCA_T00000949001 [Kuraishia capsulata CBS 1993]CDK24982.1 unnamed protein product [Kuraishia capsulata CBS 1993]